MKNIVLCFDRAGDRPGRAVNRATNVLVIRRLLDDSDTQLVWYHPGHPAPAPRRGGVAPGARRREAALADALAAVTAAHQFLVDWWQPDDAIFMFGVGRGAYCAQALTHLLGLVGVPTDTTDTVADYALTTYALPRTARTRQDWLRVSQLLGGLAGDHEIAVPVRFLGLWDMVGTPGYSRSVPTQPLHDVVAGRHAVAIDGGPSGARPRAPRGVQEVWFRGAHCDVTGSAGACWPLADIALDWIIDGALAAGAVLRGRDAAPSPGDSDALAGSAHPITLRKPPVDALIHASVDLYLRAHPQYWRRLPDRVTWTDRDWLARSERLAACAMAAEPAPTAPAALFAAS